MLKVDDMIVLFMINRASDANMSLKHYTASLSLLSHGSHERFLASCLIHPDGCRLWWLMLFSRLATSNSRWTRMHPAGGLHEPCKVCCTCVTLARFSIEKYKSSV